mmetsp:Transcript_124200/g.359196  ORF Transcript_124200/g.359196 Transcript_124200/m.359196 type:complete len:208 (-) Transcript_124200:174-797(-)
MAQIRGARMSHFGTAPDGDARYPWKSSCDGAPWLCTRFIAPSAVKPEQPPPPPQCFGFSAQDTIHSKEGALTPLWPEISAFACIAPAVAAAQQPPQEPWFWTSRSSGCTEDQSTASGHVSGSDPKAVSDAVVWSSDAEPPAGDDAAEEWENLLLNRGLCPKSRSNSSSVQSAMWFRFIFHVLRWSALCFSISLRRLLKMAIRSSRSM